jgi:hypothetical protein
VTGRLSGCHAITKQRRRLGPVDKLTTTRPHRAAVLRSHREARKESKSFAGLTKNRNGPGQIRIMSMLISRFRCPERRDS